MNHVGHFLTSHPLVLLAVTIVLEQAGIPIAAAPILLLIGALTGSEAVNLPLAILVAISASVFVDCAWFDLGQSHRSKPAGALSHLRSMDARSFRISHLFTRRAGAAMFVARFLPGPNFAAALAGLTGFSRLRFVLLDITVSGLWAMLYLVAGRFLPKGLRVWLSSAMSASPGLAICFILGSAAVILVLSRFSRLQSRHGASEDPTQITMNPESTATDIYPNSEIVQTGEVQ